MRGIYPMTEITTQLVEQLIHQQFPQWADLAIYPVAKSGNDNRTFHLGSDMTIRLPSSECYAPQVEKEQKWLPILSQYITLPIPCPIKQGQPTDYYPFPWSINHFIIGETASYDKISDLNRFAVDLAAFLLELQAIDTLNGPAAGLHNFYRGGDLSVYDKETKQALKEYKDILPTDKLNGLWELSLSSSWEKDGVWIHGDIATGNLLVDNGCLCSVIDFGIMGVGDPACDYVMAWTFFDTNSRQVFFDTLGCDSDTINRARGWALWKALITYKDKDRIVALNAKHTIQAILEEITE